MLKNCYNGLQGSPIEPSNQYLTFLDDKDPVIWRVFEIHDQSGPRGPFYPVPFITIARDGSNFPGEKMSALLLTIPQWDSFY